jgi:hypothetical protein
MPIAAHDGFSGARIPSESNAISPDPLAALSLSMAFRHQVNVFKRASILACMCGLPVLHQNALH